LRMLIEWAIQ